MNPVTQVLVGMAAGLALWKYALRTSALESNPKQRRKKKFVRVRGHMRCMPKRRPKPEPEVVVVERIIERPVAPLPPATEGSSLTVGERAAAPVAPAAPPEQVEDDSSEPTLEDMQLPNYRKRQFPWRTAVGAAAAGAAVALIATFAYQGSQRGAQP